MKNLQGISPRWKLEPPDVWWIDLYKAWKEEQPLTPGSGSCGDIYKLGDIAVKPFSTNREATMIKLAGDCAIKVLGHVMKIYEGRPVVCGLLLEAAQPLDITKIGHSEKFAIALEMISTVEKLHDTYHLVHGDIKSENWLRCKDGKLRMCDFEAARPICEDWKHWDGLVTRRYFSPRRSPGWRPMVFDDLYALAITIWEVYTGKHAFLGEYMDDVHVSRRTVDVMDITDVDIREWVTSILREGGALV
ncbi:hypothetical protein ABW19_dt0201818 [Dactylella cylindrospora]|nr:hypothetical protein ABW19_dt0201818 [Dactylella cylindrospora]